MNRDIQEKFLWLIRYSMGIDEAMPVGIAASDWTLIYEMASKQALLGVCATGIERMGGHWHRPTADVLARWIKATLNIESRNRMMNMRCAELTEMLAADGHKSCVLKGQGAAMLYPNPLRRQSGDIDVWVDGGHDVLEAYVHGRFPDSGVRYHHIDFPVFADTAVEVHFMPSWMSAPLVNKRLQRWFAGRAPEMFAHFVNLPDGGRMAVPTVDFNMVYMLLHIYHHLFDEGIGLRQLMDYYYVMALFCADASPASHHELVRTLRQMCLYDFAGALMYVMREVFHVPDDGLVVPVNERKGRFVLAEILRSGNFGRGDDAIDRSHGKSSRYFGTKFKYKLHFFSRYPSETLWGNAFWVWQRLWRIWHGYV